MNGQFLGQGFNLLDKLPVTAYDLTLLLLLFAFIFDPIMTFMTLSQSHNQKIGTIPDDTPNDAGGRGRHFKSSELESQPLPP